MTDQQRHTIRLWGPWQIHASPSDSQIAARERRVNLKKGSVVEPVWEPSFLSTFEGQLTLTRRFNCPTGLERDQKLTFELDLITDQFSGRAWLNETDELGQLQPGLQSLNLDTLTPGNRLQLVFEIPAGGLVDFPIPPFRMSQLCIR